MLLSAWEMELFETDPGFQLPGPHAPSAMHQERGRCWKHICQHALMVSGTSLSLSEPLPPTLEETALSRFNSSWPPTGGCPGGPLEGAAPEGGLPLSGADCSVCSPALLTPTTLSSAPLRWQVGYRPLKFPQTQPTAVRAAAQATVRQIPTWNRASACMTSAHTCSASLFSSNIQAVLRMR